MEGSRGRNMSSPFALPTIHLRSMTRYGITAWAHDVIDELPTLGILDPANGDALNDLVGIYKNLEQFFVWVFERPRTVPGQPHGPLQPPMNLRDLFLTLHRLWADLERDLRPEKDGAFIDQMIDNLGWLWDTRTNLKNRIHHTLGLPLMSGVDALAEAASYAQVSDTRHRNIIQSSTTAIRLSSAAAQSLPPAAPASKSTPRNGEDRVSGSRKGEDQTRENIMPPTRDSSFPISSTQTATTGQHLPPPKYSQLAQKIAQSSMRRVLASYNARLHKSSFAVQHRLTFPLGEAPRSLLGLANNDNYKGLKNARIPLIPIDSTLLIPRTRERIKPESGPCHNTPKKQACGSTNKDAILISESPSPEPDNAPSLRPRSQSNHLISSSMSFHDPELQARHPAAAVPHGETETTGSTWQSGSLANSWTPINGSRHPIQAEEECAHPRHRDPSRRKPQSMPHRPTNLGPIDQPVGVNPAPKDAKTAKDIDRPYSARGNFPKEGPGNQ